MGKNLAWVLAMVGLLVVTAAQGQYALPTDGTGNWAVLGGSPGATLQLQTGNDGPEGKTCQRLVFTFSGQEQEFAAAAVPLPEPLTADYVALKLTYRALLPVGAQGPVMVLHEKDGGDYHGDPFLPAAPDYRTVYVPFTDLKAADWAKDANQQFDLAQVVQLRLAVVSKNAGPGMLWVSSAEFVKEIPQGEIWPPRDWQVMAEEAVTTRLTQPAEGPEGNAVPRLDFDFTPGAMRYALLVTRMSGVREIGVRGQVKVTYRTQLPAGVPVAIVMLVEKGGASYVLLLPPSAEWDTVTLPLSKATLGEWSKDDNNRLDVAEVNSFGFGTGGTVPAKGSGTLWLEDFSFVE